jgi:hypothetical protein
MMHGDARQVPGLGDAAATRYFSLGRHALAAGLKALDIGKGHVVLVPEYICRDLLAAVRAVDAEPLFYPVTPSLAPRSLPPVPNVKAVIAVNYFGFPQALKPFRAFCVTHGAALIEDNAHGFLSCDSQGTPLGTRGDLGIFSLRKTFAVPDGAALLVNRGAWLDRLPAPLPCRIDPLPASIIVKRAVSRIQNATGIPTRRVAEDLTRHLRRMRTGRAFPASPPEAEVIIPGEPAIHCDSARMLEQIDATHEVKRRRALYQDFHRHLGPFGVAPLFGDLPPCAAPYGYPFRADVSTAAAAARIARNRGFDCCPWPELPAAVAPDAPEYYRNVWWVNFLC